MNPLPQTIAEALNGVPANEEIVVFVDGLTIIDIYPANAFIEPSDETDRAVENASSAYEGMLDDSGNLLIQWQNNILDDYC